MKIVDYQATPSGYYQISFRNDEGHTIVVTQHGRGGCNLYQPHTMKPELLEWLDQFSLRTIFHLEKMGLDDLANVVRNKDNEWEDSVVLTLCDLIDMGRIRVEG